MPASQTQSELAVRLQDLGHQYLPAARALGMIDTAAQDCLLEELWPFRKTRVTLTGSTLTDGGVTQNIGPVKQVVDTSLSPGSTRVLEPRAEDILVDNYGDLTLVAPARFYYVVYVGGARTIKAYPTAATSLKVTHFSTAPWVTGGAAPASFADVPVWPKTDYETLLAKARVYAYEDIDDYEAAAQQEAKYQRRIESARDQMLLDQWDESDDIVITQELV